MIKRWKFIRTGMKSENGRCKWTLDKWQKPIKKIEIYSKGYHCSKTILQALGYIKGEILLRVECQGESQVENDKEVYQEMKAVRAYKWTKEDSVSLAIFAAELVIDIYEKKYPNDDRPRKAIEAAKNYLKNPSASAASAADAAAASAADAAAWSAAAWSAASAAAAAAAWSAAAWSAASAAADAAWSASAAAAAADAAADARIELTKKIDKWLNARVKKLEEIK